MSRYHYIERSDNRKTGPIPTVYSERSTCPPSCKHYRADCYAEDFFTRLNWDKVGQRGVNLETLTAKIKALDAGQLWRFNIAGDLPGFGETVDAAALGEIVAANIGRRGFTYTHKQSEDAIKWAKHATAWGFTVNLSADDAGHADELAAHGLPVVCIVPSDTPDHTTTPEGRTIKICPAQVNKYMTCAVCELCQKADRRAVIGFRAHGARARITNQHARRVIPTLKA
jgi:hypothetical protein